MARKSKGDDGGARPRQARPAASPRKASPADKSRRPDPEAGTSRSARPAASKNRKPATARSRPAAPAPPAAPAGRLRPAASRVKSASSASSRSAAAPAEGARSSTRRSAGSASAQPRKTAPADPGAGAEALQILRQENNELLDIIRTLRAERDSALAEASRSTQRVEDLEGQLARRSPAGDKSGPGAFDPGIDLGGDEDEDEEDEAEAEDELECAAGFFDRIDELRSRRIELDRERADRELEQSEQAFWMICPKCGDLMEEQESESVKLERCETCGGLYLDRGEVDLLLSIVSGDRDGLRRLHNALKF